MANKAKKYLEDALINKESGNHNKAIELLKKSLSIADDPIAINNLAICYQFIGNYSKAEEIFIKAINNNQFFLETYLNLALINFSFDRPNKSFEYLMQPFIKNDELNINKNTDIWIKSFPYIIMALNLIALKFKTFNEIHIKLLKFTLSDPDVRTKDLRPALSFYSDARIKDIDNNIKLTKEDKIKAVTEDNLISSHIEGEVNTGLITENFFTTRRTLISGYVANNKINKGYKVYIEKFLKMIVMQNINNQYIWSISERDKKNIKIVEKRILDSINKGDEVSYIDLLLLMSYEEILSYKKIYKFLKNRPKNKYPELKEILKKEILDREEEENISKDIKSFSNIEDSISKKVKSQYEENPYPRWMSVSNIQNNKDLRTGETYTNYFDVILNNLPVKGKPVKTKKPRILVAGCGTGKQPISISLADKNLNIDAFDISLASLSYGIRMARELGINNINWFQADILDLKKIEKKYDMIECVGVLHHMDDTEKGFNELEKKLKPFGLMKIGVYAKYFRDGRLKELKKISKEENYKTDLPSIRKFRERIKNVNNETYKAISNTSDFHSSSSFRDLLMHAHERSFTIPELEKIFKIGTDYTFLGFEFPKDQYNKIIRSYNKSFPEDIKRNNLKNWNIFEEKNPDLFAVMYQFYLQKNQ